MRSRRIVRDLAVATFALTLAVLFQETLAQDFRLLGGAPDLLCVVVVSLALLRGAEVGALAGFAGGLLLDVLTFQPIGLAACVYTAVGHGAGRLGERVSDEAPVRPLLVVAVGTVAARTGLVVLAFLLPAGLPLGDALSLAAVTSAAFGVLLAIPLLPLLRAALSERLPAAASPTTPADRVPPVYA